MKTLNYIDPIMSPSIILDRPDHHISFEKVNNRTKRNNSPEIFSGDFPVGPIAVQIAKGSGITDADKNEYIDFYLSQGANILGHASDNILDAVEKALRDGANHGMPTLVENLLAKSISEAIPSMEQIRLVNSGTEAVNGAIRLAKVFTGKHKVIRFEDQCSVPTNLDGETIRLPFNNQEAVSGSFFKYKDDIAAIIVEPVPSGMGVVLPKKGYLQFLRNITAEHRAPLIFDETTTGFRPKISGAQGYFGISPDLTILGKIVGGGFPVGAFGGSRELMSLIIEDSSFSPINPITATAGIATLKRLNTPLFYETLNHKSRDFIYWLEEITKHKGIVINSFQSMFSIFFSDKEITNYEDAKSSDVRRFDRFHKKLMKEGIYLSPSPFEANFLSIAHLPEDLNRTLEVVYKILKKV